jgi:hypothetical protein
MSSDFTYSKIQFGNLDLSTKESKFKANVILNYKPGDFQISLTRWALMLKSNLLNCYQRHGFLWWIR